MDMQCLLAARASLAPSPQPWKAGSSAFGDGVSDEETCTETCIPVSLYSHVNVQK